MKNYLILGATSGIGLQVTKQLLESGSNVFGVGRNTTELLKLQQKFSSLYFMAYDLKTAQSAHVWEKALIDLGQVDVVFLNSGVASGSRLESWEAVLETIETNVLGTSEFLLRAYNYMKENNTTGVIAVNTSLAGMRGLRQAPFYSASKAFLINLCQALSAKNKKEGIDIKILDIRPGFVATKMSGGSLWQCPVPKAAGQIIKGFSSQCSVVYISRRWALVGALIHFIPTWLWDRV